MKPSLPAGRPASSVLITKLFPQEEDVEVEGVEFNVLRAFHHEVGVDALAWSPESRLDRIPTIRYCCRVGALLNKVI